MKRLLALFSIILCSATFAAEFYVDSNAAADTATGSQAAPFTTIKAAVDAVNAQYAADGLPSTIYVKGGNACSYTISTADDLISITASNLTMCAWADYGAPKVYLDRELSANTNNPWVITVEEGAHHCTIKDFEFYFYIDNQNKHSGTSLGQSGRVISVWGGNCTVESCKFFQDNKSTNSNWGGNGAIISEAEERTRNTIGYNLTIKNCLFSKVGKLNNRILRTANEAKMIANIFDDCSGFFFPVKQSTGGLFVSNKVINANAPIYSNGGNYGEYNNMEIAYNIFVNSSDTPFFSKTNAGMSSPKIHHNTIVGSGAFIGTSGSKVFQWTPSFYNNLIILTDEDSAIITEETTNVGTTNPTTFKAGSIYRDNVWLAPNFNAGSAPLELTQYKLEADNVDSVGLYIDNNLAIYQTPEFLETENIYAEDFYRLNSVRYPWVEGLNSSYGTEPAYIGAVEPIAIQGEAGEYFAINSFQVEATSYSPLSEITFIVAYSLNAGPVTISWDFDGDGTYDYFGSELSTTHSYPIAGDYVPTVKVVDTATGKEIVANLTIPTLSIRRTSTYVDALAADDGDGTEERPYKTIAKGVAATGENGTVFVRGGEDRVYEINSSDDFVYIENNWTTIKAWGDFGNAKVVISHELNSITQNPFIFNVDLDSYGSTISDLDFVWYGSANETYPGDSIGTDGRIINANGERTTIRNCSFRVEGASANTHYAFAISSDVEQNYQAPGKYLTVEGCTFEGCTGDAKQMNAILTGRDPVLVQNVFTNCYVMFAPLKGYYGSFSFVSNALYECRSIQSNNSRGNYNEIQNADIAYNTFITSTGEPFITKVKDGLKDNVLIHHNTIIGASTFILVKITSDSSTWKPQIYDNLILLADDGVIIEDNSTKKPSAYTSSFRDESAFYNNAYIAANFSDGTAAENISGYDLTLEPVNCYTLTQAPIFMSKEIGDEDEYRMRATKFDWQFTAATGGYPNYVGAMEPFEAPLCTIIIIE